MTKMLVLTALLCMSLSTMAGNDPSIKGALRENIQQTMMSHVESTRIGNDYVLYDPIDGKLVRMALKELHSGIVHKGDFYVSCADFKTADGVAYDVDFMVAPADGELRVFQALVHKVGSSKRAYHLEDI